MQQAQNIQPMFEVEILEGTEKVTRTYFDDGVMQTATEEVPRGWNVYFPAGHSIRIRTDTEMRRLGFLESPSLLDMESGESVQSMNMSLKENTRRKTRSRKKSSATGGIMKDG